MNMDGPNLMVAEFLHYNHWANLRLLEACLELTPEQLAASAPGAYGSIYDTLVHLVRAEAAYCRRLTGLNLDPPFNWKAAPPLSEIQPYAEQVSRSLAEAAARLQFTDTLERTWREPEWDGHPERYKSVSLLIQVLNHGVEHRTNITTTMAQLGLPAPDLSGWGYIYTHPDRLGA